MADKATREAYGQALVDLGRDHEFYVLDADLAGSVKVDLFGAAYPERYIECGIAEANMMGVAAGIASTGIPAVASSYAMFTAGRAYEQIRNSIAYPNLHVVIGASHAGVSVGEDGASHQCVEDIALMRVVPNMTVISPCDAVEAYEATKAALLDCKGPVYLRLSRPGTPAVNGEGYTFTLGKGVVLKEGKDVTLVATGLMVAKTLKAAEFLKDKGIDAAVINIHTIKPIDQELLSRYAEKTGHIVTIEEHSIIGGLGSAVAEAVSESSPCKITRVGINDTFGLSGSSDAVLDYFGLTPEGIAESVLKSLS